MPIAIDQVSHSETEFQTPTVDEFLSDVVNGLSDSPKHLPSKYFYDQRGSQLFDKICNLPEYYVTRAELEIMQTHAHAMANRIGSGAAIIEYGSGSSLKTDLLLEALPRDVVYLPVDISHEHLWEASRRIAEKHEQLHIYPVTADFTQQIELPTIDQEVERRVVYFPGSTIGNFDIPNAQMILNHIAELVGPSGGLLIGIDLRKEVRVLEAAYNDTQGVTAEFNLNLLRRMNEELNGNFNLDKFSHQAIWNEEESRIEMHLVSLARQTIEVSDHAFKFQTQESICTEHSHKYDVKSFTSLAEKCGLQLQDVWKDSDSRFAVLYYEIAAEG